MAGSFIKAKLTKKVARAVTGGSATVNRVLGGGGGRGLRGAAAVRPGVGWRAAGTATAIAGTAAGAATLGTLRAIPNLGRQAFTGAMTLARNPMVQKWSKRAIAAAGYIAIGSLVYDAAGNLIGQKQSRRMNPLNHRALSRAIRRVKGAKRICRKVESITGSRRRVGTRGSRSRAAASCD